VAAPVVRANQDGAGKQSPLMRCARCGLTPRTATKATLCLEAFPISADRHFLQFGGAIVLRGDFNSFPQASV
jgi:hypothetical protein